MSVVLRHRAGWSKAVPLLFFIVFTQARAEEVDSALSTRLLDRLEQIQWQAQGAQGAGQCLSPLLASASLNWEGLDSYTRQQFSPFMTRPTDAHENVGNTDVSYEAYGATVVVTLSSPPFRIIYALNSEAAVEQTDVDANGTPDYVDEVEAALQEVYSIEIETLGYREPVGDGAEGGGTDQYDVYLTELSTAGVFGYVSTESCSGSPVVCSSYMVIDNDYAEDLYSTTGTAAMQVTVAHEFFHAIQFAYELEDNGWWMENSATWVEDIVYDDINDYVHYMSAQALSPTLPLDTEDGSWEYGNVIWPRYLSESYGNDFVREVWEGIADEEGTNTLLALETLLELEDTSFPDALAEHKAFNQNKLRYEEGASYWGGEDSISPTMTVSSYPRMIDSANSSAGGVDHLAAHFLRFEPGDAEGSSNTLLLSFDGKGFSFNRATAVLETTCENTYEWPLELGEGSVEGALEPQGFGSMVSAVTLVVSNGCYGEPGCDNVPYSVESSLESSDEPSDADGDCVPPLLEGGLDCDDNDAERGPFAPEQSDGVDNDCDGALDEAAGVPTLVARPLVAFQGQDFDIVYITRYLDLEATNTYSSEGLLVGEENVLSSLQAEIAGFIGVLASTETALDVDNGSEIAHGILYVEEVPRLELVSTRPTTGSLDSEKGIAILEVSSSVEQILVATAKSTGSSPFTPELRWIDTDGLAELARHVDSAGVEAAAGKLYLRISDEAGGIGSGFQFSVSLTIGCSSDKDADGFVSDVCPDGEDCNDSSATVYPGAEEIAYDGVDQDCSQGDLVDQDGDGYAALAADGDDCDDLDMESYPGAEEVCDTADNDCDGIPNDGLSGCNLEVCDGLDNDGNGSIDEGFDADNLGGADCIDDDEDGYSEDGGDCDDTNTDVFPGGSDIPYDGIDQDCVGGDLVDLDYDGYASTEAEGGTDCDDHNSSIHPNAPEICDLKDNDCDDIIDEDTDFDGIGGPDCLDGDGDGYTELEGDCQDEDAAINPAAEEIPYDGIDQDCSSADLTDVDGDGYVGGEDGPDCDDSSSTVNPGLSEVCDGEDNNCDGDVDETFDSDGIGGADCLDDDGDGSSEEEGDCNDANPAISGNLEEVCDTLDNNCDGSIDEGWDLDGIGGMDCTDDDGDGYSEDEEDCLDDNTAVSPAVEEVCDTLDNDCDGETDEGFDADGIGGPDCVDNDFDKFSEDQGDCDDTDRAYYPGAKETPYNGRDEDCSGADLTDVDNDGFDSIQVEGGDDCDDENDRIYPGATEIVYNGIDEDCDGYDFQDADLDGYASTTAGGEDCDDLSATVYPGADEVPYNGVDEDCDQSDLNDLDGDKYVATEAGGNDCDDQDPSVHPYAQEVAYDGIDQDCTDGDLIDVDEDFYEASEVGGDDCDDTRPEISPAAKEVCYDGIDNNCNGKVDEACEEISGCSCDIKEPAGPGRGPFAPGALLPFLSFAAWLGLGRSRAPAERSRVK